MLSKRFESSRNLINLIILFILLVTSLFPTQSLAAPPNPDEKIETNLPDNELSQNIENFTPPDPGDFEEERAREAIEKAIQKLTASWGPRYQLNPVEISINGEWAIGSASWKSDEKIFDKPVTVIAKRFTDGKWFAMTPDRSDEFSEMLMEVPDQLLSEKEKDDLLSKVDEFSLNQPANGTIRLLDFIDNPEILTSSEPNTGDGVEIMITPTPMPSTQSTLPQSDWPSHGTVPTPVPTSRMLEQEAIIQFENDSDVGNLNSQESDEDNNVESETGLLIGNWPNAPMAIPTSGYIGKLQDQDGHSGIDIWTSKDESYNPPGNEVRLSYEGKLVAFLESDYHQNKKIGLVFEHNIDPAYASFVPYLHVYTLYFHLANDSTGESYINPSLQKGQTYPMGTLLGYQGNMKFYKDNHAIVHLHFCVARTASCATRLPLDKYLGPDLSWPPPPNYLMDYIEYNGSSMGSCSAPDLTSPSDGFTSPGNTITFAWSHPNNCSGQNGFLVRVGTSPGGNDVKSDVFIPGLQGNISFDSQWFNRDLYWSVRANVNNGTWSGSRRFRIESSSPSCNPGANQIALFVDGDYRGQCVVKGVGQYPNPSAIGLPNDQISSIKVGSDVRATLCQDDNYQGVCEVFLGDDPNLTDNSIGNDTVSSVKVESRTTIPLPPEILTPSNGASFLEGESITLSWTPSGDQYSGEIWGGPGGTLTFGPQGGTSINIGSQWAGYTYYWHVKAHNSAGSSDWSDTRSFTVIPGKPTNLSGQVLSCSQIHLEWNDNSGNEQGFELHRNNGNYVILLGPNTTSYTDTGLNGNTTYTYQILAYRGEHKSDFSNQISITTSSCATVPEAPTLNGPLDGEVFDEGDFVYLSWSANANEYSVEIWGGPDGTITYGPQNYSYIVIIPQWAGYNYSWRVRGKNSAGWSNWSETRTFTLRPGRPESLTLNNPDCNQINVSWSDESENEEGYRVYRNDIQIASLGPNTTYFSDTGVNENTTYSYYVKAYRGTITSLPSSQESIVTQSCTPPDYEAPSVDWLEPVVNEGVHDVVNEFVYLKATASDNVGVDYVNFSRWDAVNEVFVEIGNVYTEPYGIYLDCSSLNLGWNQINVYSVDTSGNSSDTKYIWLFRNEPMPDLMPYAPEEFEDAVVISSVTDTTVNSALYAGQPIYIDWLIGNLGWAPADGPFHVQLWIDDALLINYPFDYLDDFRFIGFTDWIETISEPGWHLVQMVIDPDNAIEEANEDNNVWAQYFYWESSLPYYDDMESGAIGWDASGLWHLVDDSSQYQNSYSGTTSWWYGQEGTGDYDTGAQNSGDLTSPNLYIPYDESGPFYIHFQYWYSTESQLPYWDQRWVQASIDNGAFVNILRLNDDLMEFWHNSPLISLSGLEGHTIRIRFHFDTIDEIENAYRGWYIDDFSIAQYSPPTCGDTNEPNNGTFFATQLYYGAELTADICGNGDFDYYQFTAEENDSIVIDIDAVVNGSSLDSFITLRDSDNMIISANDDDSLTYDSKLGFTISSPGTYYIRVRDYWHPSFGGPEYHYNIKLYTDNQTPEFIEFINPVSDSWLDPFSTEIEVDASDSTSGIARVEFLWHSGDWENDEWIWLGSDSWAYDGWKFTFDTSLEVEQYGAAFYVWAFDFAGNYIGEGVWNLGIDNTPPETTMGIYPMYEDAPFRDFYVTWYGNDNVSGIVSYDVQVRDGYNGEWVDLLTETTEYASFFVGENGHNYYFRSRARDFAGNIGDFPGGDGQVSYKVQLCPVAPDTFEGDDSFSQAKSIAVNTPPQSHNFHVEDDQDWVKVFLDSEKEYVILTEDLGLHSDTVVSLYDQDGTTLLLTNDDYYYSSFASRIDWKPDVSGIYYVKVNHWDPYGFGCSTGYNLAVNEIVQFDPTDWIYLPLILR